MPGFAFALALIALLLAGGVFGFFYAWSFTVMRGLGATEARAAIAAMQSVNATIMTPWFAILFFGTPVAAGLAAWAAFAAEARAAAFWLAAAGLVYLVGCFGVTVAVNVPMNDALARLDAGTVAEPASAWRGYAGPWTAWNHLRTAACGAALLCCALALRRLPA